jgi:hypothetical protein
MKIATNTAINHNIPLSGKRKNAVFMQVFPDSAAA